MLVELAIGDAYGAAFEFVDARLTLDHELGDYAWHPWHDIAPGRYTDDTQMSIAIAELVVSGAPFTPRNVADVFVSAFKRDPRPGYAPGFYAFLQSVHDGAAFLARIRPESDKNGAAMRAVPLGVYPDLGLVIERTALQARLTHDTPEGTRAALAVALAAHFLLYQLGAKAELPAFLSSHLPGPAWGEPWYGAVDTKGHSAVRAALCLLGRETSLGGMLAGAVRFGGDVDTVAAIALGLGACSRETTNDLPPSLLAGLESGTYGRDFLRDLDRQLFCLVAR